AAADQHDPLLAQAALHGWPVDLARLDLLLDPHLHQAGVGMVRAHTPLGCRVLRTHALDVEHAVTVTRGACPPLAPAYPAPRPAAGGRPMARPGRWPVENGDPGASLDSPPWRITELPPIDPPTKPRWPGRAGVQPLRITQ